MVSGRTLSPSHYRCGAGAIGWMDGLLGLSRILAVHNN